MSLMNINFVIASENPKELSGFYGKINSDKVFKGFNSTHYFISLGTKSKIHFYRPSKNYSWNKEGNSTSLCFQGEPNKDPDKIIETWTFKLLKLGARIKESRKSVDFGSEQWLLDPEGNQFLILVPFLINGIVSEAAI